MSRTVPGYGIEKMPKKQAIVHGSRSPESGNRKIRIQTHNAYSRLRDKVQVVPLSETVETMHSLPFGLC